MCAAVQAGACTESLRPRPRPRPRSRRPRPHPRRRSCEAARSRLHRIGGGAARNGLEGVVEELEGAGRGMRGARKGVSARHGKTPALGARVARPRPPASARSSRAHARALACARAEVLASCSRALMLMLSSWRHLAGSVGMAAGASFQTPGAASGFGAGGVEAEAGGGFGGALELLEAALPPVKAPGAGEAGGAAAETLLTLVAMAAAGGAGAADGAGPSLSVVRRQCLFPSGSPRNAIARALLSFAGRRDPGGACGVAQRSQWAAEGGAAREGLCVNGVCAQLSRGAGPWPGPPLAARPGGAPCPAYTRAPAPTSPR